MKTADRKLVERQREHFERIAHRYIRGRLEPNHVTLKHLMWDEALANLPLDDARAKVLEPMCGSAEGAEILERRLPGGIDYSGFDYSGAVVEEARARKPDATIWIGDVTQTQLPPESYDIVILIGGLHHVPSSAGEVVRALSASLKRGGVFINFEPTAGNPLFRMIRRVIYRRNSIFDEQTERDFTPRELFGFFERAGLRRLKAIFPGLSAYVLYYNPYAFGWLNVGTPATVRALYRFDSLLRHNRLGRMLSFATLSIWQKPDEGPQQRPVAADENAVAL